MSMTQGSNLTKKKTFDKYNRDKSKRGKCYQNNNIYKHSKLQNWIIEHV
jgi:hypothetical protein